MNIIKLSMPSFIQSWGDDSPIPDGYAILHDEVELEEFYLYNGYVNIEVEDGVAISFTPNAVKWEEWKSGQPNPNIKLAEDIRAKRDKLLTSCDWTQCLDAPLSEECVEEYRVYRQVLRDITEQEGFPTNVVFPNVPQQVKI